VYFCFVLLWGKQRLFLYTAFTNGFQECSETAGKPPLIFNLGTTSQLLPRPLYLPHNKRYPLNNRLDGAHSPSGRFKTRTVITLPLVQSRHLCSSSRYDVYFRGVYFTLYSRFTSSLMLSAYFGRDYCPIIFRKENIYSHRSARRLLTYSGIGYTWLTYYPHLYILGYITTTVAGGSAYIR
jgi:hypothetical protein